MNIQLTPELERLVQSHVRSGNYESPGEVIRAALRLLEERQLSEVRNHIDRGLAQSARGEGVDGEAFTKALIDDLDAREVKRKAG